MLKSAIQDFMQSLESVYSDQKKYKIFLFTIAISLIVGILGLKVFLEITEALRADLLTDWDDRVSHWIHQLRNPVATKFVIAATQLGNVYAYLVLIILIAWYAHQKERGWYITLQITLVLATAALLNIILKFAIDRQRPQGVEIIDAGGLSFPSGHAMGSFAFYGFLIFLVWAHIKSRPKRIILSIALAGLILLIGFTRVYLGVHYPSDVVAGYAAGLSWLAICIWVFNLLNHRRLMRLRE
ncbi:MAG: phosphatidylglycerophosphatase B [Cyclobacteriaceae bacterium]|nr:MAG: phosphatidylglycerophosphatase B [Cyclobacteriaceae bacterium]